MCGFVGFKNTPRWQAPECDQGNGRPDHPPGPDDADYYVDDQVSLGFRRLSIIDLEGGRQPILNEDGTKVLVFNGKFTTSEPAGGPAGKRPRFQDPHRFGKPSSTGTRNTARTSSKSCGDVRLCHLGQGKAAALRRPGHLRHQALYYYENGDQFFFGSEIKLPLPIPAL